MTAKRQWLAERVAQKMRARLAKPLRPGGRLASVRELASDLGVCVETVRAAQKLLVQEGVLEIRHGSGVYVADHAQARCVGIYTAFNILQPRTASFHVLTPHFLREFLHQKEVASEIYVGSAQPGDPDSPPAGRFQADIADGRLSAVAILTAPSTSQWRQWVGRLAIPAIGVHTPYGLDACYGDMVARAVRHLRGQGCRGIAMLSWGHEGLRPALRDAMDRCGLAYRPEWVRGDLHPMLSGAGWEEFREIWTARIKKPDGLLVTDDVLFDEVCVAIRELGIRVPDQLRIVTHASKGSNRRYPFPVTLAQRDTERYAEALGKMLLKLMRGEPVVPATAAFPFEMVESDAAQAESKEVAGVAVISDARVTADTTP